MGLHVIWKWSLLHIMSGNRLNFFKALGYRVPFRKLCSTRVQNCNLGTDTVFDFNKI